MIFNSIAFPDIKGLDMVNELMEKKADYKYLALVQYEDIIDYYLMKNHKQESINQLAYYLYIAYDIRLFNIDNIKFIRLIDHNNIPSIDMIDTMNAHLSTMVYDSSFIY